MNKYKCVVFLALLNCTHCFVWSESLYWIVHNECVWFVRLTVLKTRLCVVSLLVLICSNCCCGLTYDTELNKLLWEFCLSVLNFTQGSLRSVCRYWTVHNAECGRSIVPEQNKFLCEIFLSVPNISHCCVWSVCRYWILHIAVCGLSLLIEPKTLLFVFFWYWTIHIAVCVLTACTEFYTLLCVVCISLLKWTYCSMCSV